MSFQALAKLTFFICSYTPLKTYPHQHCNESKYIRENINKIEKMQKMLILYII
jgi:hypothetical protein